MDIAERNALVLANQRLVWKVALQVWRNCPRGKIELDDLVQAGNLALCARIARTFDASRGFKFSTYAQRSLAREMVSAVHQANLVHVPANLFFKSSLAQSKPKRWEKRALAGRQALNVSELGGREILDHEHQEPDPDEWQDLWRNLWRLSPRERMVLRLRYGLADMERLTLKQAGQRLRLTKQRVQQIEMEALAKLRAMMAAPTPKPS